MLDIESVPPTKLIVLLVKSILPPLVVPLALMLLAVIPEAESAIGPPSPVVELESSVPALVSILPLLLVIVIPAGAVILLIVMSLLANKVIVAPVPVLVSALVFVILMP